MISLSITQRIVLVVGLLLILLSFLFPCWNERVISQNRVIEVSLGQYHFIFRKIISKIGTIKTIYADGNISRKSTGTTSWPVIDYQRLFTQLAFILIITIGFILVLSPRKNWN